ncbi:hypothetical protein CVT91_15145 [Candidatus Atribacteria bacterium HGW-Atribacteria-1]|nr:MAG: hypothetical protein CVT91_15145 [Candidatus Atribacteria bacterium HGW-Atribacteria-1]
MKSMENFFIPHSVVIFASMKEGKTGYEIVKNMVEGGFKGNIYPVSQSGGQWSVYPFTFRRFGKWGG